jgi:hypothetical protein
MRVKYPTPGGLPSPVKPFGSVNVEKDDKTGELNVIAQVLMDRLVDDEGKEIEGAEFGLALDGSASMKDLYGTESGPFGFGTPNIVEPVAKSMLKFLADYAGDGTVELAYWAVGPAGKETEGVGKINQNQLDSLKIRPQKKMGRGTHLLPIIKHFVDDKLKDAPWAMAVIITDGLIDDMEDVEKWTDSFAVEVDAGKRKLVKLVLIGLGENVDAGQLERLDDFEASVDVDVWSSKLASEMEALYEVFDEVMSEELQVAPSGKILDNNGKVLRVYNDGLPAKMEFKLAPNSTGFKIEVSGQPAVEQDLAEALNLLK